MKVEVIDSVSDYVQLMKEIFDFSSIREFVSSTPSFTFLFDAMHAVTGHYATQIFIKELGFDPSSVINAIPKEDFGNGHPDPNLTVPLYLT
jgi:phosphoglucomutase